MCFIGLAMVDYGRMLIIGLFRVEGPVAGCLPDANDIVNFDAASFSLSGQVVEIPLGITSIRDMIWAQPVDTVLIRFLGTTISSSTLKINGSLTLATKVKVSRTGIMEWNFAAPGAVTLDTKMWICSMQW